MSESESSTTRTGDSKITSVGRSTGERREGLAPCTRLRRQEADEQEAIGRQPGHRERGRDGARAGHRDDRDALGPRVAHQPVAGIGDPRRARVRDQRHVAPGAERLEDPSALGALVVLEVGGRRASAMPCARSSVPVRRVSSQATSATSPQNAARPQRQVLEVAERRCHDEERARRGVGVGHLTP